MQIDTDDSFKNFESLFSQYHISNRLVGITF